MEARRQDSDEAILLPIEVIQSIFRLLSRKELKSLRIISHEWRNLINPLVFDKVNIRAYAIKLPRMYYYEEQVEAAHKRREKDLTMENFDAMWGANSTSATVLCPLIRTIDVGASIYTLDETLVLIRRCPGINTLKLHTNMLQEAQQQFWEAQSADTGPFTSLEPFFAAMPRLTHLKISGPTLNVDFVVHALLPYLGSLHCLELNVLLLPIGYFDPINSVSTTIQEETDTSMHQISKFQDACPDLTSLRFELFKGDDLPAFHSAAGLDTACGACTRPWLSVTYLKLVIPWDWPTDLVPELLAHICLKFPNLKSLKMETSSFTSRSGGSRPRGFGMNRLLMEQSIRAPTNAWRHAIDTSYAHLAQLTAFEYIGTFVSVILDALHLFTTGSSAKRASALVSLKIGSRNEDSAVDPIDILTKFPLLRTLNSNCRFEGWWAPNGSDALSIQALISRLPLTYHPLRTLILQRSGPRDEPLIAISKMCRDLTSVFFYGGSSMDLSADIAEQLPVDPLVQFDKSTDVRGTIHWLSLPYSTRLKHINVDIHKSNVYLFLNTPKLPNDDIDDGVDDSQVASHNVQRACGWLVKRRGDKVTAIKKKDIQSLGRDTQWVIDNALFRPGQKQRQKDAGAGSAAVSAINAARRYGVVVILAPSQPQSLHINSFCAP
ncbi:hypothetical protein BC940DRAFT_321477 [Gongronella butleri]|nr:hypothetical protein BC940DRAFT_321477 [Gongronella butleri]